MRVIEGGKHPPITPTAADTPARARGQCRKGQAGEVYSLRAAWTGPLKPARASARRSESSRSSMRRRQKPRDDEQGIKADGRQRRQDTHHAAEGWRGWGIGGPAGGDGWGGSARGGGDRPGQPFELGNQVAKVRRPDRDQRRAAREAASERLEEALWHLAHHATNEMTQVRAAAQLHAIYAGNPVARTVTAEADGLDALTDAELRDELDRLSR